MPLQKKGKHIFLENNSRNIWLERIFSIPLHTLSEDEPSGGFSEATKGKSSLKGFT